MFFKIQLEELGQTLISKNYQSIYLNQLENNLKLYQFETLSRVANASNRTETILRYKLLINIHIYETEFNTKCLIFVQITNKIKN